MCARHNSVFCTGFPKSHVMQHQLVRVSQTNIIVSAHTVLKWVGTYVLRPEVEDSSHQVQPTVSLIISPLRVNLWGQPSKGNPFSNPRHRWFPSSFKKVLSTMWDLVVCLVGNRKNRLYTDHFEMQQSMKPSVQQGGCKKNYAFFKKPPDAPPRGVDCPSPSGTTDPV